MTLRTNVTIAALLAAAVLPTGASAAAPWTPPATIPDAAGSPNQNLFTAAGHGVVLSPSANRSSVGHSQVATITPTGAVVSTEPLDYAGSALATYARDRVAVAGQSVARSGPDAGTIDDNSSVVVRFGAPSGLGAEHVVAGTKGQQLFGLASNRDGLMALVTGASRSRTVFLRRPGSSTFTAKLRIKVSNLARGAAVAVGESGDVLVAYEDAHEVRARHIGARGSAGAVHRLGPGVQSDLQAAVNDDGRLAVAWKSQRVSEGEAATPAIVWFATAAPRHGFGAARKIATVATTGSNKFVASPGVRLIADGDDALLAYTGADAGNYAVQAARVTAGHVGGAQRLSPAGEDAVLGDAALAANGAQVVAWRSGVAGSVPAPLPGGGVAHTPVLANVRAPGAAAFGPAEAISPADVDVPLAPSAAIDPVGGAATVAFGFLTPSIVALSARATA
ncbi:MAG: hypothetical protein QOJ63_3475 [Solirubrobacteraceae bacterium]|nr:hypothetical protein [Solirubrobacteraceae bacterium]